MIFWFHFFASLFWAKAHRKEIHIYNPIYQLADGVNETHNVNGL